MRKEWFICFLYAAESTIFNMNKSIIQQISDKNEFVHNKQK